MREKTGRRALNLTGAQVAATASIEPTVERGLAALRRLDAIVRNKFRDDPATLAAWKHARHIERPARQPRRNNGGTNTPAPGTQGHES